LLYANLRKASPALICVVMVTAKFVILAIAASAKCGQFKSIQQRKIVMSQSMRDASKVALTMDIPEVAEALRCTDRHIYDLRKQKRMPLPTTVGVKKCVRWSRRVIEEWIDAGCPALAV
jgi:predicted DNA-binding transcriptional regulator AlpA